MTRLEAKELIRLLVEAQKALSAAEAFVGPTFSDQAERDSLRKTLANAVGMIDGEALAPVIRQFPDLDPFVGINTDETWPRE